MKPSHSEFLPSKAVKSIDDIPDAAWQNFGFRNPDAVRSGFARLRQTPDIASGIENRFGCILHCLTSSSDPDQAFLGLERWLDAEGSLNGTFNWTDENFLKCLCILFAATPALSEYFIRFPNRTVPIIQPVLQRQIVGGAAWRRMLNETMATCTTHAQQMSTLRRMRVECMLQIAALDLRGICPMSDTVRALSDLADACVQTALEFSLERLRHRYGAVPPTDPAASAPEIPGEKPPFRPPPFVVFALGKLGGRELNYSCDIDLVFAHAGSGETVDATHPTDVTTYFMALGKEITSALDKTTEEGRVYRVDLRLRPYGSTGALVPSVDEMQNYFQTEGRTWERQAWLKARTIAGDIRLGDEILKGIETFIYKRYLSLDAISDMQALKRQIELSVARRGESEDEVKLGRGGIRDIEFTVQFMQLLHGSEYPSVRTGSSLQALYQLRRNGLMADAEIDPLAQAYIFLRNVEHRLQLHGDLQVHKLPSDPISRRRIALSLGYMDVPAAGSRKAALAQEAFENDRLRHTNRTREIFERLFANLFRQNTGIEAELSELLLAPEPDVARLAQLLPKFGFPNSEATAKELIELSHENLLLTSPSRTRKFFASVAPMLLKALASTGVGDDALRRFSRIVGSLGARAVFYQTLNENPWLLKMTADLAAWSEYLTAILVANPGLFDELVDALQTGHSKTVDEMAAELQHITRGGEINDTLRAYRSGELLRVGVRDLIHDASLEQTQQELSDLAEAILRTQLAHTMRQHCARLGRIYAEGKSSISGRLTSADMDLSGFAVLALGKFGGREMNYGSDLDVLYFYECEGVTGKGLPAVSYYAEFAQDLTRSMAAATTLGTLYELDARLRPNGNKGPLAQSLEAFLRYWKDGHLADWERMALTRARFVAGDEGFGERVLHAIRNAVYSPLKDTDLLKSEVVTMRRRLEEGTEPGDLKRGRGGIMDIEFIAQYLQLIHGAAFPPLRQSNTAQALHTLIKFKKIPAADGKALLDAYDFMRTLENRVRVVHGTSARKLPTAPEAVRKLALRAGIGDASHKSAGEILIENYKKHAEQVREIFERITK